MVLTFGSECQIHPSSVVSLGVSLLAVATLGPKYLGVEIGGRPVGGDAVSGGHVRFWRRWWRGGLLSDLHRRGLNGSRLAIGRLRRSVRSGRLAVRRGRGLTRTCRGCALLNRANRLGGDGLNRLGRGNIRCGRGRRLARTKNLGVEVGGRALAGDAVHGPIRLVTLTGRLVRRLGRRRIVRRRAAGNGNRNRGQGGGGPDAR